MADFNKVRIIEAGPTANSWTDVGPDGEPVTGTIVITPESLASLAACGNIRPIHSRKTHNGNDLLDAYIGKFSNFVVEDNIVYADFDFSEAMAEAYPNEVKFMRAMIEKEPEMLGVSVVDNDLKVWNEENQTWDVQEFLELYTCDLVGLPAATSSLFNNQKSSNKMGMFSSIFSMFSAKTKLAETIVEAVNGEKITIKSVGEEVAIGDSVVKEDGTPVEDGEVTVTTDEGQLILVIKDGMIESFKEVEEEVKEEEVKEDEKKGTKTPDEFSKRLTDLEKSLGEIKTMLSKHTKTPPVGSRTVGDKTSAAEKTQLSNEEARAKAHEAMQKYAKMK
ncbi:hypothetical protein SJC12_11 [Bacteroides phage SJC12]|nr:hypothetical protein SJC01_11 [Bacteroides phage SJC01]QIG64950.1 hypothetical protein SJC09_11 [Bacteroides phage SJC09]QIG65043.1 hypothetical protein SJC11_11 [Bacteroides phage SJC11]QIG65092.1 hypothetical protein SJC12_11 [Bacteroides phage SJC12]QIG65185.1 hypothetical protein SJC14_11 [Bacteroides phage SJC14]QIG65235.1 hypothetical protein SJC15_11 [Bacteroides phage SJC15]QIG65284.1 hypothetical protein SJC16_11 [Bacteroides phage SJC16]QIG65333.1 hypothetical protein SJC17_11 [